MTTHKCPECGTTHVLVSVTDWPDGRKRIKGRCRNDECNHVWSEETPAEEMSE